MTQLTDKIDATKVPEQVKDFMSFMESIKNDEADTPLGTYRFLFTTKTATEEDARKVVMSHGKHFRDYERKFYTRPLTVFTAIESLHSLLRSKNLDDKNNYALIEKLSSDDQENNPK